MKAKKNDSMMKKMQIQMDNLEAKVAKECKEGRPSLTEIKLVFLVPIFSAPALKCRRAIALPPASVSASTSAWASAYKMLGQMLKSWNFSLSVFFLAF